MPFTRTISFNKWHFEESVAAAWHVLVNSNLAVAGVLKYQGLQISSARVLKVINWRWMLWNYKRFRLKRCMILKKNIHIKIYTLQWTKTYSRSFRKSVTDKYLKCQGQHKFRMYFKKKRKKEKWALLRKISYNKKIKKNILIVQYYAVPLRQIKTCLGEKEKIYLRELFLTLSWCQVHLVPERKKRMGKKTSDLCDHKLQQSILLSSVCLKPDSNYGPIFLCNGICCVPKYRQFTDTVKLCVIKVWPFKWGLDLTQKGEQD